MRQEKKEIISVFLSAAIDWVIQRYRGCSNEERDVAVSMVISAT
jgi:hypothetical protein